MNSFIKSSGRCYLKRLIAIFKYSLIALLLILTTIIVYLSFFGPKHFNFIDGIVKHNIEKNLDQISISKIRTGISLDLKDMSIVLGLDDWELSYKKSAVFMVPNIKLKFDIYNLLLQRNNKIFKGIVFDERDVAVIYDKSQKNNGVSQEKIPIENVINILKKYQHLMKDSSYIV